MNYIRDLWIVRKKEGRRLNKFAILFRLKNGSASA